MAIGIWFPSSEPDTWQTVNAVWADVPNHARLVLEGIDAWNEYNTLHNRRYDNPYLLPHVQAFTVIKTLPTRAPWLKVKHDYYQELAHYMTDFTYEGNYPAVEKMDKFDIFWGIPLGQLLNNIDEIDQAGRAKGIIVTFDQWATNLRNKRGLGTYGRIFHEREKMREAERFVRREIQKCKEASINCPCLQGIGARHTEFEMDDDWESIDSSSE